jgi:hypothetical protein
VIFPAERPPNLFDVPCSSVVLDQFIRVNLSIVGPRAPITFHKIRPVFSHRYGSDVPGRAGWGLALIGHERLECLRADVSSLLAYVAMANPDVSWCECLHPPLKCK